MPGRVSSWLIFRDWGFAEGGSRDSPRLARHFFFATPKEKYPKERRPEVWVPCAALRGNLRCSVSAGSGTTRCAQTCASPCPLPPVLLGPASTGFEVQRAFASLGHQRQRALRAALGRRGVTANLIAACASRTCTKRQFHSKNKARRAAPATTGRAQQRPVGLQNPLRLGRGAQGAAGCRASRGRRGLSERSEFRSRLPAPSTAGCPVAQRRGPRRRVAFSLLTFSWRSKRK